MPDPRSPDPTPDADVAALAAGAAELRQSAALHRSLTRVGTEGTRQAHQASAERADAQADALDRVAAWLRTLTAERDALRAGAEIAMKVLGKAGGTCLGVAMSGRRHPAPDEALMDVFKACQQAAQQIAALGTPALPTEETTDARS